MKFSLSWLKDYLDTKLNAYEISDYLTNIGLEVEKVTDRSIELKPFTVAYVKKAEKHPNADRLKVCEVETNKGIYTVICGASNARTGMKAIFAPEGSYIPGSNITLKKLISEVLNLQECLYQKRKWEYLMITKELLK